MVSSHLDIFCLAFISNSIWFSSLPVNSLNVINRLEFGNSKEFYESLKWAYAHKLQFLDIGVSQLYEENKIVPHDSLINFKEQFGAESMIRKVMELKL